ncbi:hypothetical protein DPX16_22254 [Anabarilius grahami]|uniref:Uncharacterized protein n=1 Tax=Anabarilius grahami TaxID=495550 RepID=A0A3N0XRD3_ANAGA|nr:hypothetical protein DPX16_22254 [Anabarilius grahami]
MNALNAVLFIVVWTSIAVCQADDDVCSVSCEDVTGTVGEEVTLTCSVSQKCSECCITLYKFHYPEKHASTICREEFPLDSCEKRNSFTCRYTPTKAMTEKLRFFFQTTCDKKITEFTVNKTETPSPTGEHSESRKEDNTRSNGTVIAAVVGCFFILIIIIMAIIYKGKPNIKHSRLQKWVFLVHRQEQSPQHEINVTDSV